MSEVTKVKVDLIDPNPFQQRTEFDEGALRELADSIKEQGMISPVTLRPDPDAEGRFQLIAGERRLRAHKLLGLDKIESIIRSDVDDAKLEELALIENVQRENLSPIEEANGYQRLLEKHEGNVALIARKVGKNRATVEKRVALLNLPTEVQKMVDAGDLGLQQADLLLGVEEEDEILRLAKAASKASMDINRLKGLIRSQPKERRQATSTPRPVRFAQVNKGLITMADLLERFSTDKCSLEDFSTLLNQFRALRDQINEDVIPAIEEKLESANDSDDSGK